MSDYIDPEDPENYGLDDTGGTGDTSIGNTPPAGTSPAVNPTPATGSSTIGNFTTALTSLFGAVTPVVTALRKPTAPAGTAGAAGTPAAATNWTLIAVLGFGALLVLGLALKFMGGKRG